VEFEPMDKYERELQEAMVRLPAPPNLKRKILDRRRRQNTERVHGRMVMWQRFAASVVLAAIIGGVYAWHSVEQRRKGEEARRQVLTALRITSHALQQMNQQLADRSRNQE